MSTGSEDRRAEHDRVAEFLPWLVNGTLPAAERELVERHVRTCLPCRAALKAEQRLAVLVRAQPTVPLSADENFARLDERMRKPSGEPARHAAWLLGTAAALALAAWLAVEVARPPEAEFSTLTDAPVVLHGTRLDVVFAPDAAEADVRSLVRELNGTIVAGPNDVGRYTISIGSADGAALDAVLLELQRDPRVRFAARSFAAEGAR